ncbi:MAG: hypothetical protein P4M00_05185 [Azospirillaceae bacterium]|nr:hypothetical protein [Azospirillaceae bacterium]
MRGCDNRRIRFAAQLQRNARRLGLDLSETIAFAFRRRYNLPPNDPRFLSLTIEDIAVDYWAHRFWDDPELRSEIVDPDFAAALAEAEAAAASNRPEDWETMTAERY